MNDSLNFILDLVKDNKIKLEDADSLITALRERIIEENSAESYQDIAIIGMGCRFPKAENVGQFWRQLALGEDCITEIPPARWPLAKFYHPSRKYKSYSKWGGFIDNIDKFAADFFGISQEEAAIIDPQQRLFLEVAYETLEERVTIKNVS